MEKYIENLIKGSFEYESDKLEVSEKKIEAYEEKRKSFRSRIRLKDQDLGKEIRGRYKRRLKGALQYFLKRT